MAHPRARVVPVEAGTLDFTHPLTRRSVFWELDPLSENYAGADSELDKASWLLAQAYEQKTVGFSIVDPRWESGAYATVLMCPPAAAPGAVRLPTSPFSADAYALTSLHIDVASRVRGWEAVLIDAAVAHLSTNQSDHALAAVEAFGLREDADTSVLDGIVQRVADSAHKIGLMPVTALESAGFTVVADHPAIPRLRLDLPPEAGLLSEEEIAELLATVPATS